MKANKYDLSSSRYRQVEQDVIFYESPGVTLERMRQLEQAAASDVAELKKLVGSL
jgi:type I restriction enzyme M protein